MPRSDVNETTPLRTDRTGLAGNETLQGRTLRYPLLRKMNWARALLLRSGRPCQLLMSLLVLFLSYSCPVFVLLLPILVLFLSSSCRCHHPCGVGLARFRHPSIRAHSGKSSRDSHYAAEGGSMRSTSNFTLARIRGQPAPRRAARSASMRQRRPEASVPPAPQACPRGTAGSALAWPRASSTLSGLHRTGKVSTIRSVG